MVTKGNGGCGEHTIYLIIAALYYHGFHSGVRSFERHQYYPIYLYTDKEPKPYSTNSIMYEDIIMLFDDYYIMISFWENEKFYF